MALNRHLWLIFAYLTALNDICNALSIDSIPFRKQFANRTTIALSECNEFCGSGPNRYEWKDIQARVVAWIVPVIILVGSFQFAPLRLLNTMFVALHLMADPFTSIFSLLTKLATHQKIYNDCQNPEIPDAARKSMAILLAAYEDWESYFLFLERGNKDDPRKKLLNSMKRTSEALQLLLCDQQFPLFNHARIMECQVAAKELSDSRVNGLAKTLIGNANCFVTLALAFLQVNKGDCVAAVPVSIATASAFWISVTNPTNGVGCRSIFELFFFSVWILSAVLSARFRRFEGGNQLFWTRAKDFVICLTPWVSIAFGFGGLFNSCFC